MSTRRVRKAVRDAVARDFMLKAEPLEELTGRQLCAAGRWDDQDLLELVAWGCPVLRIGQAESAEGWVFVRQHVHRYVSLLASAVEISFGPDLPAGLRAVRERLGIPRNVPSEVK